MGSLLLALAKSIEYQVIIRRRKEDFVRRKITGKWFYEDKFTPVMC